MSWKLFLLKLEMCAQNDKCSAVHENPANFYAHVLSEESLEAEGAEESSGLWVSSLSHRVFNQLLRLNELLGPAVAGSAQGPLLGWAASGPQTEPPALPGMGCDFPGQRDPMADLHSVTNDANEGKHLLNFEDHDTILVVLAGLSF